MLHAPIGGISGIEGGDGSQERIKYFSVLWLRVLLLLLTKNQTLLVLPNKQKLEWRWRDSSEYLLIIIISIIRIWIRMFLGGSRGQTNPYHIPYHNQVLLCVIK